MITFFLKNLPLRGFFLRARFKISTFLLASVRKMQIYAFRAKDAINIGRKKSITFAGLGFLFPRVYSFFFAPVCLFAIGKRYRSK